MNFPFGFVITPLKWVMIRILEHPHLVIEKIHGTHEPVLSTIKPRGLFAVIGIGNENTPIECSVIQLELRITNRSKINNSVNEINCLLDSKLLKTAEDYDYKYTQESPHSIFTNISNKSPDDDRWTLGAPLFFEPKESKRVLITLRAIIPVPQQDNVNICVTLIDSNGKIFKNEIECVPKIRITGEAIFESG